MSYPHACAAVNSISTLPSVNLMDLNVPVTASGFKVTQLSEATFPVA